MNKHDHHRTPADELPPEGERAPEDMPDEPGAEGGSKSPSKDKLPGAPARDSSPIGDTDQHSEA
jgi:hypothetical protein